MTLHFFFVRLLLNNDTETNTKSILHSRRQQKNLLFSLLNEEEIMVNLLDKEGSKNLFSSLLKNHHVPHFHRGMKDVMRILKVKISHITLILLKFFLPISSPFITIKSFSLFLLNIFFMLLLLKILSTKLISLKVLTLCN